MSQTSFPSCCSSLLPRADAPSKGADELVLEDEEEAKRFCMLRERGEGGEGKAVARKSGPAFNGPGARAAETGRRQQ